MVAGDVTQVRHVLSQQQRALPERSNWKMRVETAVREGMLDVAMKTEHALKPAEIP